MKKSELKALIKQCLVEILNEGLAGTLKANPEALAKPYLENRKPAPRSQQSQAHHNQVIREIVGNATQDPILASIFAETAATTLATQNAAEGKGGGQVYTAPAGADAATMAIAGHAPEDLFGEAANKWAALAFIDDPKR